jgi:hypothetical protein
MLSHATAREWLIPYADGMLSTDERQRVDGHVAGCPACAAEVGSLRQLNLLLVSLPPAPPMAFAPFWLKLQAALPKGRAVVPFSAPRYRKLGFALAAAAMAVLAAAGSAVAAPAALPDNPLYAFKQAEESVQLAFTSAPDRLGLEIRFAQERLSEARAMAAVGKPTLAVKSLRSFRLTMQPVAAGLGNAVDLRAAAETRRMLEVDLAAVQQANATQGDDDADLKQLVLAILNELETDAPSPAVGLTPAAITSPATTAPAPTPAATPRSTPRPQPSPSDE